MIVKIFKAVWFLSTLVWLVVLLYVYASLPEEVLVREGEGRLMISREVLFYVFLLAMALFSGLVFVIRRLYADDDFQIWFHGLMLCLNFFFIIALSLISLANSGENFAYDRIGVTIYGSLGLFVLWGLAWPVYAIFRKKGDQEAV